MLLSGILPIVFLELEFRRCAGRLQAGMGAVVNRAERKHQKELRRRRAKQRDQDEMPYRIKAFYEPIGFKSLKGWEETAYDNLDLKACIRELYYNNSEFRRLVNTREVTDDERGEFARIIFADLRRRNTLIPPYWIPILRINVNERIINVHVRVVRPQRRRDPQQGLSYFFGRSLDYEGQKREIWYCTHAIDRIRERFALGQNELDITCWTNILRASGELVWTAEKVGNQHFLKLIVTMPRKPLGDPDRCWSLYFPMALEKDSTIVVKTMLLPGMFPAPTTKGDLNALIDELKEYWRYVWKKGYSARFEKMEHVSAPAAPKVCDPLEGLLTPKENRNATGKLWDSK
jgi:hypothetical protein